MVRLRKLGFLALCFFLLSCQESTDTVIPTAVKMIPIDAEQVKVTGTSSKVLLQTLPGSDPATFNPLLSEDTTSSAMVGLMTDGLTTFNPLTETIEPALAKSWDISSDYLEYTFYLRQGVYWSDGAPFTADDVIFTWNTLYRKKQHPDTGALSYEYPIRAPFSHQIEGVEYQYKKIDRYTVRFRTPQIHAPFLLFAGGVNVLPKHILQTFVEEGTFMNQWSSSTAIHQPEQIISIGPYVLQSYRPGERILFRKNPHYWKVDVDGQRLPYTEKLIYRFLKDGNATTIAFAEGKTDLESIRPDDLSWVQLSARKHRFTLHSQGPSPSNSFIFFNQNTGKDSEGNPLVEPYKLKWFRLKAFRQAVSYALNRPGIIDSVLFGKGFPLYGYVSQGQPFWFNSAIKTYPYNPEKALQLLQREGFQKKGGKLYDPSGNLVAFSLITNQGNETRQEICTIFQSDMRRIGIAVEIKYLDFNALVTKLNDRFDYEAILLGLGGGAPDPSASKDILMSGGRLHMWFPKQKTPSTDWEARIDQLMIAQEKTIDPLERKKIFDQVQVIMSEQMPLIFTVTPQVYTGIKDKWQNLALPSGGGAAWNQPSWYTLNPGL